MKSIEVFLALESDATRVNAARRCACDGDTAISETNGDSSQPTESAILPNTGTLKLSTRFHYLNLPDFWPQDVKADLNPPELTVVTNALASLIESVKTVNQDYLPSTAERTKSDPDMSARLSVLVKVACQALIREADTMSHNQWREYEIKVIGRQRRKELQLADAYLRQNALLPLHAIPLKISVTPLPVSLNRNRFITRIKITYSKWHLSHECRVTGTLWSIARLKSILRNIDFGYDHTIDLVGFTRAVIPLSHRWRTLEITGPLPSEVIERLK
ncbi:hypothetical protein FRB93_008916 [Tulasnella sp. JGI-2019a]|nr:hypothetical protein FRB93_008916 [Tulasnella sp. JGI-2019a]